MIKIGDYSIQEYMSENKLVIFVPPIEDTFVGTCPGVNLSGRKRELSSEELTRILLTAMSQYYSTEGLSVNEHEDGDKISLSNVIDKYLKDAKDKNDLLGSPLINTESLTKVIKEDNQIVEWLKELNTLKEELRKYDCHSIEEVYRLARHNGYNSGFEDGYEDAL